jgi:hypothetical protein
VEERGRGEGEGETYSLDLSVHILFGKPRLVSGEVIDGSLTMCGGLQKRKEAMDQPPDSDCQVEGVEDEAYDDFLFGEVELSSDGSPGCFDGGDGVGESSIPEDKQKS